VTFQELNLNTPLLNALSDLGYEYPTPIQIQAFPVIMSGKDMVGIAQTGTGKTFAYLLPLIRQLKFSDEKHPRILIVVPTRELVLQVVSEVEKLTKYTNFRFAGVYGGTNINTQKQLVYNGVDILVATPGRLVDLAMSGVLRLKLIQKLVVDEVDEMFDLGFRAQLINLMDSLPDKRQNLMFSATLTEDVEKLINNYFREPQKVEVVPHGTPIEKIIQWAYHVPNFNTKVNLLEYLLKTDADLSKVLVFVSSKRLADRLYEQMESRFPDQVGVIHSNRAQNQRINAVKRLHEGTIRILVATDIIARGLDINDVTHVVNFDTPDQPGDYIHRIGRTGRADRDGVSITFINEMEMEYQMAIEQLMNKAIPLAPLPDDLVISKIFNEDEKPVMAFDKDYLKAPSKTHNQGAFHEKIGKNKKINLGGPRKRNPKFGKPAKPPVID
jgi:ATP-dependent RNA helicase RhlE